MLLPAIPSLSSDSVEKAFRENAARIKHATLVITTRFGPAGATHLPLSVGEPTVRLLKLELKWYGRGGGTGTAGSSTGKQVSTIASRQFTNSSDDSPIMLYCRDFVYNNYNLPLEMAIILFHSPDTLW